MRKRKDFPYLAINQISLMKNNNKKKDNNNIKKLVCFQI